MKSLLGQTILFGVSIISMGVTAAQDCAPLLQVKPLFYAVEKDDRRLGRILATQHTGFNLEQFPPLVLDAIDTADDLTLELKNGEGILSTLLLLSSLFDFTGPPCLKSFLARRGPN